MLAEHRRGRVDRVRAQRFLRGDGLLGGDHRALARAARDGAVQSEQRLHWRAGEVGAGGDDGAGIEQVAVGQDRRVDSVFGGVFAEAGADRVEEGRLVRDDHAQRVRPLHLLAAAEEEMLDAVARIVARNLPLNALVSVERHINGAVAQAVDRGLQPVLGRVDHQLVDLFLLVVGNADIFERAVGVAPGHREAGEDGVHEELDDAAAQPVGDIVGQERAARGRFRRGEEAVPAAHLVDHDRQLAPLVGDSVDFGALRHHHRVAHAGHPVREVPQRVLLHQLRHRLGAEPVDVRPHRCPVHGIAGPFPEHPRRLAALIPQDFAPARIRRLPRNPAQRHRRRVRVAGVVGGVHHADGIVGCGLVQLAAPQRCRQLAPPGAIPQSPNPLAVGRAGRG